MSVLTLPSSLLVAALLLLFPLHVLWPSASLLMSLEAQDPIYVKTTMTLHVQALTCFAFLWFLQVPKSVIHSIWKFPACRKYILSRLHRSLVALLMGNLLEYTNVGANGPLNILLLLSGDIETNPGPQNDRSFNFNCICATGGSFLDYT